MAAKTLLLLVTLVPTAWSARLLGQEYFANSSLVGSLVRECSLEEKSCLTFNMLYYPGSESCKLPWSVKDDCVYAANKCAFEGGRLVAKCHSKNGCARNREWELPLAYDQLCHKKTNRCHCPERSTEPSRGLNLFGFLECSCERSRPSQVPTNPPRVLQPTDSNMCAVPDFSYNIHAFRMKSSFPVKVKCHENWKSCNVSNNEGWLNGKCVQILQETPECAEGYLPMLKPKKLGRPENEVPMGKLECRRADSECGVLGYVKSAIDHRCHSKKLFEEVGQFHRDAFGLYHLQVNETTPTSLSSASVQVNYDKLIQCEDFKKQRVRRNRRTNGRQRRKQSLPARRPINPKSPQQRRMYSKMR